MRTPHVTNSPAGRTAKQSTVSSTGFHPPLPAWNANDIFVPTSPGTSLFWGTSMAYTLQSPEPTPRPSPEAQQGSDTHVSVHSIASAEDIADIATTWGVDCFDTAGQGETAGDKGLQTPQSAASPASNSSVRRSLCNVVTSMVKTCMLEQLGQHRSCFKAAQIELCHA